MLDRSFANDLCTRISSDGASNSSPTAVVEYRSMSIFVLTCKGVLRLRKNFASRNSYSAQDDSGLVALHPRHEAGRPKPNLYGFTATRSGLQVMATVPLPFCAEVVVTPELFVTVKVPGPNVKIV